MPAHKVVAGAAADCPGQEDATSRAHSGRHILPSSWQLRPDARSPGPTKPRDESGGRNHSPDLHDCTLTLSSCRKCRAQTEVIWKVFFKGYNPVPEKGSSETVRTRTRASSDCQRRAAQCRAACALSAVWNSPVPRVFVKGPEVQRLSARHASGAAARPRAHRERPAAWSSRERAPPHDAVCVPLRCMPCSRSRQHVRRASDGFAPPVPRQGLVVTSWMSSCGTTMERATGTFLGLCHGVGKTVGSNGFAYALPPSAGERRRAVKLTF
jgi:hypothetical protein